MTKSLEEIKVFSENISNKVNNPKLRFDIPQEYETGFSSILDSILDGSCIADLRTPSSSHSESYMKQRNSFASIKNFFSKFSAVKTELKRTKLQSLCSSLSTLLSLWFSEILCTTDAWQSCEFYDFLGLSYNSAIEETPVTSTSLSAFAFDDSSVRLDTADGPRWQLNEFELIKVIGKGCMGKVLLVREKGTTNYYAMKSIHKKTIVNQREIEHSLSERHILTQLSLANHPFLVRMYGCFQSTSELFYLFKYYSGGDLAMQLAIYRNFSLDRVKFYAAEIILALEALHSFGVIYRDLKPENILLDKDGHVALTDFGLSKQLVDSVIASEQSSDGLTRTFCGTAEYLAPEILLGQAYSSAVDWWSFGTLIYEMIVGITPFWSENPMEMYHKIVNAPLVFPNEFLTSDNSEILLVKDFLSKLLTRNPSTRLSMEKVKRHAWLEDVNWRAYMDKAVQPPYVPQFPANNTLAKDSSDKAFVYFDEEFTKLPAELTPMESLTASMQLPFKGFSYKPVL